MPCQGPVPVDDKKVKEIYEACLATLKVAKILNHPCPTYHLKTQRDKRYADLYLAIHSLVELDNWESF